MKKRLLIPSIFALGFSAFSFTGCSATDIPQNTSAEDTTSTIENVDKDFSIGTRDGKIYTNDFFGLKLTVADDWTLLDENEIAKISSTVQDNINDKIIKESIHSGETCFIMYAMKDDKSQNVNMSVQKLPYQTELADFDINSYVEKSIEETKELLPQNGFEDLTVEKANITFLSEEVPAIKIKAKYKDNDIYETQVYIFKGSYMASITATSLGTDNTQNSLNVFVKQ